jgi:DNA-binding FadR family transcriptional regulator
VFGSQLRHGWDVLLGHHQKMHGRPRLNVMKNEDIFIFKDFLEVDDITDYQAYAKADKQFHLFIADIGSKEFLNTILQTLNIISLAYQNITSEGLISEPNETIKDHMKIVDAICNYDPEMAEHLMRDHLHKTIIKLKNIASEQG